MVNNLVFRWPKLVFLGAHRNHIIQSNTTKSLCGQRLPEDGRGVLLSGAKKCRFNHNMLMGPTTYYFIYIIELIFSCVSHYLHFDHIQLYLLEAQRH